MVHSPSYLYVLLVILLQPVECIPPPPGRPHADDQHHLHRRERLPINPMQ